MRSRLLRPLLALLLLPALASAQEPQLRRVLQGEPATIIFGPQGGYAPENYLKKLSTSGATPGEAWATQNGALAELIRRCTPGGKIRMAAFRCDDREVMDALFEVVRTRNVEVKLWLKGPPGLTYMVQAHEAIAQRANEYLRQREAQHKQAEWGDFQVMLGTAEQMAAFGKINDMHQKFGVIDLALDHASGRNNAFLGTSNIGASSDRSHNESRLFFLGNPQAAQRLGQEFARLWTHLGRCLTTVDGAAGGASNGTPETPESIRIRLPDGGVADERPDDVLQFRFTYERDANGQFHEISRDFIDGLSQSTSLPAGSVVWIAQFGFQVSSITEALLRAARAAPQVEYRVMVHMGETEAGHVRRLVDAKLPNLRCSIKWDSNKLVLEEGSRPLVPDHDHPGPALLHHKTMVVGDRLMITGSYNFFPDADDQGEEVVIIRNHLAPTYAQVLADTRAEFEAMWRSAVVMDAARVFGPEGLLETIEELSGEEGFLETLAAVGTQPKTVAELKAALGADAPSDADLERFLAALERFDFVERGADGRYFKLEPDVAAHLDKPGVRERAVEGPVTPPPPPPPPPPPAETETTVRGRLEVQGNTIRLAAEGVTYAVSGLATTLRPLAGREVEVLGKVKATGATGTLEASRLVSPARGETTGVVEQQDGKLFVVTGATRREAFGPAARVLSRAVGRLVVVDGHAFPDALCVLGVQADVTRTGRLTKSNVPIGMIQRGQKVWVSSLNQSGSQALVRHQSRQGWFLTSRLAIGTQTAGIVNAIPEATPVTPGQ